MRSRDGNRSFTLTIYTLVFASLLNAENYIVSYRSVVTNQIISSEQLLVSQAMTPCDEPSNPPLKLISNQENFKALIEENHDEFLDYLARQGILISSTQSSNIKHYQSRMILEFPSQCFTVEFNDGFVIITPLK